MGACLGRDYSTDNEAENLFIESIKAFSPLKSHSLTDFLRDFKKKRSEEKKEQEDVIEEDLTYNSTDYKKFVLAHLNKSSHYKVFSKEVPPTFDQLFETHIKERPEYNLLVWGLPYLKDSHKLPLLGDVLLEGEKGLSIGEIQEFVDHYLQEQLVNVTRRLNSKLQEEKNGKELRNTNYVIDDRLKKEGNDALAFYEGEEYRQTVRNELMAAVKRASPARVTNDEDYNSVVLSPRVLSQVKGFDFLFDPLELRHYVWFRFKAPPVDVNQPRK